MVESVVRVAVVEGGSVFGDGRSGEGGMVRWRERACVRVARARGRSAETCILWLFGWGGVRFWL